MAAPEYMNDLRKSSQLGFAVYSWLQLVGLKASKSYIGIGAGFVSTPDVGIKSESYVTSNNKKNYPKQFVLIPYGLMC